MQPSEIFKSFLANRIGGLSAESYRRARLLSIAILFSIVFSFLYVGITFITGFLAARFIMTASLILLSVLLFCLHHNTWKVIAHSFVAIAYALTVLLIYFSGSAFFAMLPWLGFMPLLSLLLLSRTWQRVWTAICIYTIIAFFYWPVPVSEWTFQTTNPAFYQASLIIGFILLISLISHSFKVLQFQSLAQSEMQNEELRAAEEELRQSMEELSATQEALAEQNQIIDKQRKKTEYYLNTLINLAMCRGILEGDKPLAYQDILSVTAEALHTSRVSIWYYLANENCIECEALFDKGTVAMDTGVRLSGKDFPHYFEAILNEKIIVAEDATVHPATSQFTESYLKPLNIVSMLDVPYIESGQFRGVICCEHQGEMRMWDQQDVIFVKSVADLISMAMNSVQRKQAEREIIHQREQILRQNEQLTRYASEIKTINESLETRVQERTAKLNEQNVKLTEYAFVNAHLLRGPLSRILGLVELMRISNDSAELLGYLELLDTSTKELDKVVHRITDILNEGRQLDRDSLK